MSKKSIEALHFLIQELQNKYNIKDVDVMDCYLILENERD